MEKAGVALGFGTLFKIIGALERSLIAQQPFTSFMNMNCLRAQQTGNQGSELLRSGLQAFGYGQGYEASENQKPLSIV
jgi:hypothetical protein